MKRERPLPRIVFAGDRDIAVRCLEFLVSQRVRPLALIVSGAERASHADHLIKLCPFLPRDRILRGGEFREAKSVELFGELQLDYVVAVHFPYLVPKAVLDVPRHGVLNLHPGYLPHTRGWHTPSWALLEDAPMGATLHFMDEGVNTGAIVHQEPCVVSHGDTAHTLYTRVKQTELDVFKAAWPLLLSGPQRREPQRRDAGTSHTRQELLADHIQRLRLDETVRAGDLLKKLRALTTNDINEAAFYESEGKRYRVQVSVCEEEQDSGDPRRRSTETS